MKIQFQYIKFPMKIAITVKEVTEIKVSQSEKKNYLLVYLKKKILSDVRTGLTRWLGE